MTIDLRAFRTRCRAAFLGGALLFAAVTTAGAATLEIINIDDKKPFQEAVQPVWEKYGKQQAELIKRIQDVK